MVYRIQTEVGLSRLQGIGGRGPEATGAEACRRAPPRVPPLRLIRNYLVFGRANHLERSHAPTLEELGVVGGGLFKGLGSASRHAGTAPAGLSDPKLLAYAAKPHAVTRPACASLAPSFTLLLSFAPPPDPHCSPPCHPPGGLRPSGQAAEPEGSCPPHQHRVNPSI